MTSHPLQPDERLVSGPEQCATGLFGTPHQDHRQPGFARRLDLGVGRRAAGVFRNDHVDPFGGEETGLGGLVERAALEDEAQTGREWRCVRGIDQPGDVVMLRRAGKGGKLKPSDAEEHAARGNIGGKEPRGGPGAVHLGPSVAVFLYPGRTQNRGERQADLRAGRDRICRDPRRERVRRIDDCIRGVLPDPARQALNAAKAADPQWQRLRSGRFCATGERQHGVEARISRDEPGKGRGFCRAAEDQDAHHGGHRMTAGPDHGIAGRWLSIIGIGEDGAPGLSAVARGLIEGAELVAGGKRHLALAAGHIRGRALAWPTPLADGVAEVLAHRGRPVAVLASGDPFHYGIGNMLAAQVPAAEFICLPQPSAFSLAAARMGWGLQDVAVVSLHGRALCGIVRHLHPGARILALSWDGTTPGQLADLLAARGMGRSRLTVLEALGGEQERIREAVAAQFALGGIAALNIIALEVTADSGAMIIPFASGLEDALFESDGQLTKRDVRAVTLSALAPRWGELLWDIGLGSGSIAIEWLLCHPSLRAIGIERDGARADRALRNAAALGVPDLRVVRGEAPEALAGLPQPDVIFIGGGGSDETIFSAAWAALKPGGRLVANVVTLEGEARLGRRFARLGGDLVRLEVSRADGLGRMYGWRPAMPVTQWRVVKP